MNDAISAKVARVQELLAQRSAIDAELEALFGGAGTPPTRAVGKRGGKRASVAPKVDGRSKGNRKCGLCKQVGHSARTCDNLVVDPGESDSPLPDGHEKDLADAIRDEWAEGGRSSVEVAKELAISLSQFNRIVEKYKIVRP